MRKYFLSLIFTFTISYISNAQIITKVQDQFPISINKPGSGTLNIIQDPALDTLINRYILSKKNPTKPNGFRILIYRNSKLSARNESEKIHADFTLLFPDIPCYRLFQEPNYYLVLVGNFRSKADGMKQLLFINMEYPDAFFVPSIINYDDLTKSDVKKQ